MLKWLQDLFDTNSDDAISRAEKRMLTASKILDETLNDDYLTTYNLSQKLYDELKNAKTDSEREAIYSKPEYQETLNLSGASYKVMGITLKFHDARLKVKKLVPNAVIPALAHETDLGYDLYSSENVSIEPDTSALVSTGVACQFPVGIGAIIKDRSSIASKKGVFVHAGVIDPDYRGEIKILLFNSSKNTMMITPGDKIAQMVLVPKLYLRPPLEVAILDDTSRGVGGFGSTGA